ncbi:hypothetical protein K2173_028583 [Erythroxylum novogranatense]|uniref:Uncharacterized protein n=1 Tax=Erythroxylum novogranatense TaxID=1862640 RepID=A0AAV8U2A9_9ROSI|nr:hypothetical protein K2173_028583 [Erythroxylum novogranatense]
MSKRVGLETHHRRRWHRSFDRESELGTLFRPPRWILLRPMDDMLLRPKNPIPARVDPRTYFLGPDINELIEQLSENDRQGLPLTLEEVINALLMRGKGVTT